MGQIGETRPGFVAKLRDYFRSPFHRWATIADFFVEGFVAQASDDRDKRFFNDELLGRMEQKASEQRGLYWKLYFFNLALLVFLIASVFSLKLKISIPIVDVDADSVAREILLLITATISLAGTLLYLHSEILFRATFAIRQKKVPTPYHLATIDRLPILNFFNQVLQTYTEINLGGGNSANFGRMLRVMLAFILLATLHLSILFLITMAFHLLVMTDIWAHPSLPAFWSHAIVIYAAIIDLTSIALATCLLTLPVRYLDGRVYNRYIEISRRSPDEAAAYLGELRSAAMKPAGVMQQEKL